MTHRTAALTTIFLLALSIITVVGCGGRQSLSNLTARELYTEGLQRYNDHKYAYAIEYFQTIVFNFPGESLVDTAQYYLALSYLGNKDYKLASVEFNRLIQNYPLSVYATHSQFMTAVCLYESAPDHYGLDQTDLKTSVKQMEDFIIDHPESELVPQVQEYIREGRQKLAHKLYSSATLYYRIRAYDAAKIYYQQVVDDYTDTEYGPDAVFYIAKCDFERKRFDDARTRFQNFVSIFPDHDLAAQARPLIADAAYLDAELAYNQKKAQEAASKFRRFIEDFPSDERVDKARQYLDQLPAENEQTQLSDERF
ncbi:outer membrane protein assembly factor BamD [bacterium]|nr:outer membrane protein assembly factor BamD [bacterium]MCB2202004.1 outer membrane protein assembly factor BamD [bacterium]